MSIFKDTYGDYEPMRFVVMAIVLITIFSVFWPVGIMSAGERGVRLRFGAVVGDVVNEGLYFRTPLAERVVKIDVQTQKAEVEASAASKDLQTVTATVALNWRINHQSIQALYKEYGRDYEARLISPTIQEAVKSATAQFTADELITKRAEVRELVKTNLREKLESKGFYVEEFNIVNFNFSKSFNDSIEKKVTAEQDALAAKNKLEQVKFEADQEIQKARGRAEALRIEGDALRQNNQLIELRAIEKWNGVLPTMTGGVVPFIDVTKK